MPVLVTAADTVVGTALVRRLLATQGEVRAYCSAGGDVGMLRSLGAITASGDLDDEGRIESACTQVHTVVHLGGGLLSSSGQRIVDDAATVVTAASNAGVQRLILLSIVGATADAADELRRAKHVCEQLVAASDVPSIALRTGLVLEGRVRELLVGTPLPADLAGTPVRAVSMPALVEVLAMLDEMRSSSTSGHATLVAAGDREASIAELSGDRIGSRGIYQPLDQLPLLVAGLQGPWVDLDDNTANAWELTGVDPRVAA